MRCRRKTNASIALITATGSTASGHRSGVWAQLHSGIGIRVRSSSANNVSSDAGRVAQRAQAARGSWVVGSGHICMPTQICSSGFRAGNG